MDIEFINTIDIEKKLLVSVRMAEKIIKDVIEEYKLRPVLKRPLTINKKYFIRYYEENE